MEWAIAIGGVLGAVAAGYVALRAPRLERLRAELGKDISRHQLFYERQLEVISDLYGRIASVESAAARLLAPFRPAGEEPEEDSRHRFVDEYNELRSVFRQRRLFLPKATAERTSILIERIGETVLEFDRMRRDDSLGVASGWRGWDELWTEIKDEVPKVREVLEDDFRRILGMGELSG